MTTGNPDPDHDVVGIFNRALEYEGEDRRRYLATACQGNEALHAEIELLLAVEFRFLEEASQTGVGARMLLDLDDMRIETIDQTAFLEELIS